MFGWMKILDLLLGVWGKFRRQKYVEKIKEIKHLNFKIRQRELERKALEKIDEEVSNHRDYLNRS